MEVLLNCSEVSKAFGARILFRGLSLSVHEGERLGVIGPNGSGKTTLLEILAGLQQPDAGVRSLRKTARLGYVPQDSVFAPGRTVRSIVDEALGDHAADETERAVLISVALSKAGFEDEEAEAAKLSGGWRKRLAVAAELAREPDLLLLDEPTNHLDLEGIAWLERLLTTEAKAAVFVSHDRYFLENVSTAVAEISRVYPAGVYRAEGSYSNFLEKRAEALHAEAKRQEALENQVRREVEWLRRGPKARTSKSRGRIDAAHRLIDELAETEDRMKGGRVGLDLTASERKTKRLVVGEGLAKSLGGRTLFRDLDFLLTRGVRLGIVGPNGSGKTTLLHTMLGDLEPDSGVLKRADGLTTVVLDQHRSALAPGVSLRKTLAPDSDSVMYQGSPVHVVAWAKRFLFRAEQLELPVGELSGGEKARVALALMMTETADVLALDEPTNDLDIPTLEALEETLLEHHGALVLITHDRHLLDRVCTAVIGLDGDGEAGVYADIYQWIDARDERRRAAAASAMPAKPAAPSREPTKAKKKLSYHEQREWDTIETRIVEAEERLATAVGLLEDPGVTSDYQRLQEVQADHEKAQKEVDALYARWAELEEKTAG